MKSNDDLIKKPIPEMLKRIAIPASIGFFFMTMYNVTDTFWAGRWSTEALAALALSFPIFFIIIAMGNGVGTGSAALISNSLGAGKKEKAKEYMGQAASFGFLLSIAITIIGLTVSPFLFKILGASNDYLGVALEYINIIFYGSIFFLLTNVMNSGLIATGDTTKLRNFQIIGFFVNLALDPIFMFGLFGMPKLGIAGIALATVLIQAVGMVYITWSVFRTGLLCKKSLHNLIPRKRPYKEIAMQGFPASLNMMTVALGIFVITYFISWFGQEAVAAYGIATRIEQIALLPTIGLNMAALSLVGQNNGAKKYDRVYETWKTGLRYGFIILAFGGILVFFFARQLMGLFTKEEAVIAIGAQYLPIAALIFFAYTILFLTIATLQGLKKPMYALYIGAYRQIFGPLVFYWILASIFGIKGVWWGVFIVTWSAALITLWYGRRVMKKLHIIST
ncbi:MATE family efflux transporter [Candidatus Woesearchaeota archaeon]|nr:MATE family efflux transporter [Candidatus Woesearchaeota archaeon]